MRGNPIRKAIILFFVYSVFIIGIFVLQFRSDSVVNKSFGALRVSVDQSLSPEGETIFKNRFKVTYKGINFSADESTPVVLNSNNKETILVLEGFEESKNGFVFKFNNNASVSFSVSGDNLETKEDESRLSIVADVPRNSTIQLGYKPVSGYTATEKNSGMTFTSKGKTFSLNAGSIEKGNIILSSAKNIATFAPVFEVTKFYLASIDSGNTTYALSEKSVYDKTVLQVKNALINNVQAALSSSANVSETTAVAYVAEMAARNSYRAALEDLPDSIKKSQRRSYVSSTYFNSLVAMEPSLRRQDENLASIVNSSIMENSLDAFMAKHISDYIAINSKTKNVEALMEMPTKMEKFEPTLAQASSILDVYIDLKKKSNSLVDLLLPVLENCVEKVEECCVIDGEKLRLVENGVSASLIQTVSTGTAILNYAKISGKTELEAGARLIVDSVLTDAIPVDLHELTELYSMVERENVFYPHVEIIYETEGKTIWAWTSAQAISYKFDAENNIGTIEMKFPAAESHHLMIKGIDPFNGIDIYGIAYRTDPRFETYNSSGYAYNSELKTLFLKSRHKSDIEEVKLYFGQRPAKPEPVPEEKVQTSPTPSSTEATSAEPETTETAAPEPTSTETDED